VKDALMVISVLSWYLTFPLIVPILVVTLPVFFLMQIAAGTSDTPKQTFYRNFMDASLNGTVSWLNNTTMPRISLLLRIGQAPADLRPARENASSHGEESEKQSKLSNQWY
jgi:hypothetical protein